MTLQNKTFVVIAITFVCLIGVLYAASQYIVLGSFSEQENQDATQNVERVRSALADNIKALEGTARDWSIWDDTLDYVTGKDDSYYEANLAYDTPMVTNRLNLMAFIDSKGNIVFERLYDLNQGMNLPFPDALQEQIYEGSPLLKHTSSHSSITGILALPGAPLLIASEPILGSNGGGAIAGTLIFGRFLDTTQIKYLAKATILGLTIQPVNAENMPADFAEAMPSIMKEAGQESTSYVRVTNSDTIAGYTLLKDVYGQPALVLRAEMPRDVYARGLDTVNYYMLTIVGVGMVFGFVIMLLLKKMVLSRVARLNRDTASIAESSDMSARVQVAGSDELSHLAVSVNNMLLALHRQHEELKEGEERYRAVVEQTSEAIFLVDTESGRVVQANVASQILLGYTQDELLGMMLDDIIAPDSENTRQVVQQTTGHLRLNTTGHLHPAVERRYRRKNATIVPVEVSDSHILYGGRDVLCVVARDITDRKRAEVILHNLAMRDGLTGLYNRREMQRILTETVEAYHRYDHAAALILLDLDHFKSVNDTYGHQVGDDVLRWISRLLCELVRPSDSVARYGGEELAVIMPDASAEFAVEIGERLRLAVASQPFEFTQSVDGEEKTVFVPVTISLGVAALSSYVAGMQPLIEAADQALYEAKRGGRNRTMAYRTLSAQLQAMTTT